MIRSLAIPPGETRIVLCDSVGAVLAMLQSEAAGLPSSPRWVVCSWPQLPMLEGILDGVETNLAEVALGLWPEWYGREAISPSSSSQVEQEISFGVAFRDICRSRRGVSSLWLQRARRACQAGQLPVFTDFPREVRVCQLSLAIEANDLQIALVTERDNPEESRLFGLAKAASWLAEHTGCGVAILVHERLSARAGLDSIRNGAVTIRGTRPEPTTPSPAEQGPVGSPIPPESSIPEGTPAVDADTIPPVEQKQRVWPVIGRPHPFSPGEQLLARRLRDDSELRDRFRFNEFVTSRLGSRFLVDLVWPQGKAVVEVDGYRYHSAWAAFCADRHRDYELTVTGYVVLRLPHHEVMSDIDGAIEKIRRVVRLRSRRLRSQTR